MMRLGTTLPTQLVFAAPLQIATSTRELHFIPSNYGQHIGRSATPLLRGSSVRPVVLALK